MVSMSEVKNKIRRAKYNLKHDFFTVENVVLALGIVLCLVWTYQSVVAMSRNWQLSERLAAERKELELLSVEVATAELENEYYKTDEYQELMARKHLDKKLAGENMVVMPENSEAAKAKDQNNDVQVTKKELSNFDRWMNYLFPKY